MSGYSAAKGVMGIWLVVAIFAGSTWFVALVASLLSIGLAWRRRALRNHRPSRRRLRLERYVPSVLRGAVLSGSGPPKGLHEITALFVDLRGYTTYAEDHEPEQVFSMIQDYTRRAANIIRAHGGSVIGFSGDGLLALFGCPRHIAGKEQAAVRAGLKLVRAFPAEDSKPSGGYRCEVGVGIATDHVYVGTIHWRDQLVWSATGNAPILAARLQAATRRLEVSMAVDAKTFERAPRYRRCFDKVPSLRIRGRRRAEDVFTIPRTSKAASTIGTHSRPLDREGAIFDSGASVHRLGIEQVQFSQVIGGSEGQGSSSDRSQPSSS